MALSTGFKRELFFTVLSIARSGSSIKDFAERCGIGEKAMASLIHRKRDPSMEQFDVICVALGLTHDHFFSGFNDAQKEIDVYRSLAIHFAHLAGHADHVIRMMALDANVIRGMDVNKDVMLILDRIIEEAVKKHDVEFEEKKLVDALKVRLD